ncbi:MAG: DNA methyltransferase [Kiritimatiellae bacterium]|nr:DNA methyltransferase [Kiritimatiellia bacterium]
MDYNEFIAKKHIEYAETGIEIGVDDMNAMLFDWQKQVIRWALRKGKSAIFADCGLGKTAMQLEWANHVHINTGMPVMIIAPLAVSKQTKREGIKFGIDVNLCLSGIDVVNGINITNYERLEKFDCSIFAGIVLDESSILKSFTGKIKKQIIEYFDRTQFKLACTATPSPNDFVELGNHAEFLNIMSRTEMLATYFVHEGSSTAAWRLKGHAESIFWQWIATWAIVMKSPVDIGYDGSCFDLPELRNNVIVADYEYDNYNEDGQYEVFNVQVSTLSERRDARKESLKYRIGKIKDIVDSDPDAQWLVWVDFNAESSAVADAIGAIQISGSDAIEHKENSVINFADGTIKRLVTKPSIAGFGVNWQSCHNMIFCGLSDSYEMFYQSVRRCWRFGQKNDVNVYIVIGAREEVVLQNIMRKSEAAATMTNEMIKLTRDSIISQFQKSIRITETYKTNKEIKMLKQIKLRSKIEVTNQHVCDQFAMYNGDSCEVLTAIESDSIHYSVFSPPFADLYTYSNSERDLGNCKTETEFFAHFKFIVNEMFRIIKPGRLLSFHCMNLPTSKERDGYIGIRDFRGDLIKMFQDAGFIYHSEVCIWKDPVTAMQRTKALGLLHKQIRKDSAMSRQGIADYLVTMRKPGDNDEPIAHEREKFPVSVWQNYASPVWMDINQSDTLQRTSAREERDEKHICPLQLEVIRRAINLWTNPGDIVLSPFAGIGSEVYQAVKQGRIGIGIELKKSYYAQAVKNCLSAIEIKKEQTIFDIIQ